MFSYAVLIGLMALVFSALSFIYWCRIMGRPVKDERWWKLGLFSAYFAAACALVGLLDITFH